jgi:hypothetical protein
MWTLMLLPVAVAVAILVVRRGARSGLHGLWSLRLRAVWLIWAAAVVQFLRVVAPSAADAPPTGGVAPVVLIWVLGAAFVAVNLRARSAGVRAGLVLLAIGFTLNTVTILANGAMPVSADAARGAGLPAAIRPDARYEPVSDRTVLSFLGDVVAVPVLGKVISPGDLAMFAGISGLLIAAARSSAPAPQRRREVNRT